ncbi:hypothetical protein [Chitinimonas naiadis]
MNNAIKLLSASLFGLALVQASAAGTSYTDDVRRAPVFSFSEDAYNSQFVSPDNTDAFRATSNKAAASDTIVIAGKARVSPDNTDAFRRNNTSAELLAQSRTGRDAHKVAAGSAGVIKQVAFAKTADEPWYSTNP